MTGYFNAGHYLGFGLLAAVIVFLVAHMLILIIKGEW